MRCREHSRSSPAPTTGASTGQFLGELGQDRRLFVIAAVQEAIEQIGDFDRAYYRKIKDRFPLVLRLSATHVRDLVAHGVLVKRAGYAEGVQELARHVREALPGAPIDFGALCSIYPIHPATLELLEEVRDRFSQARGVVDFVTRQLAGDPTRHIAPFLDEEWGSFVTPDAIVRHFEDVLSVQAEFLPLSRRLLPWYRNHLEELFETPAQRRLAEALLRLLVLVHLSPARDAMTAAEATYWLLMSVARVDPSRNRDIVERVLDRLATRGRYVRAVEGRYRLDLDDDSAGRLDQQIEAELAELPAPEIAFELLAEAGLCAEFNPFTLPRAQWQARSVAWRLHPRPYAVVLGTGQPPARSGLALCVRLPWGEATAADGCYTVLPRPIELAPPLAELAAMVRLRQRPIGPEEKALLERRIEERAALFALQVRDAYARASIVTPEGRTEAVPVPAPSSAPDTAHRLDGWLDACAHWMLRRRYGSFERVAPSHGPLPLEAHRAFHRFAREHDLGELIADQWVMAIREGYLAPMGLLARAKIGRGYEIPKNIDRNELVQMVLRVADHHPATSVVYTDLADSVYGLVPDQVHVLLAFLVLVGEIDVVKGSQSLRDGYETLPTAEKYDRIVPGSGLGGPQLRQLDELCEALAIHTPKSWTVTAQRNAVRRLHDALVERTRPLPALARKLEGRGALALRVSELLTWCSVLADDRANADELRRFEQFLDRIGGPGRLTARLQELSGSADRIDRQLSDVRRLAHLLSHPALRPQSDSIGAPPVLGDADAAEVDRWLSRARAAHEDHAQRYRSAHEEYWQRMSAVPAWQWRPPEVANSRHTGLLAVVTSHASALAAAERIRCARLANLDFQVACDCGFDGARAPIEDALATVAELADRIERDLRAFFAQDQVRTRVRGWLDAGLEPEAGARAYLEGAAAWPEVRHLALFDEHMAGVDLIRRIGVADLARELGGRTWEPLALVRAFEDYIRRCDATGLRIEGGVEEDPTPVVRWCMEHALRTGSALPRGLADTSGIAAAIEPSWLGAAALGRLESLGLDDRSLVRIVTLIASGQVTVPATRSPLVEAVCETIAPTQPHTAEDLARLAERLYRHHALLAPALEARWLARLDALAVTPLEPAPRPLADVLAGLREASWLVIDALGLALLAPIHADLEAGLPIWKLVRTEFAEVGTPTTTDAFYRRLLDSELRHRFEKINAIDELLHRRALRFDELCALACAELRIALGRLRSRLDRGRPLVVFADHGFRLGSDGRTWRHGGSSTLERVVPVLHFEPY
jgi:hypothetical protein